jgi:hypothetical protein
VSAGGTPDVLLDYTYKLGYPVALDDRLSVYDDGGVWYWSLKPPEALRDRVGTFGFRMEDEDLEGIGALADEALEEDQGDVQQQRGAVEILLRVRRGEREGTLLLSAEGGVSEPLARLRAIGDDLRRRAEATPLGVVRQTWRTLEPSLQPGTPATLLFAYENLGLQPVDVLFKQDAGFTIYTKVEEGVWQPLWQSDAAATPGLVGPGGQLLGGIYTPATLPPGSIAQAVFGQVPAPQESGTVELGAGVEGWISLLRPDGADDFPQAEFRLENEPLEVEVRG